MKVLGVIPARGGSKAVPHKNIKLLNGKPLIAYTIESALRSSHLNRVIVSTDDEEIAKIARDCGADTPFIRSSHLATDKAPAIDVLKDALMRVEGMEQKSSYDAVVMLQPTTPFRTSEDIDGALDLLDQTQADSVISVVDVGTHHPERMKYLEGNQLIDPSFCESVENQPRQQLKPMFIRNGAIYATRREILLKGSLKGKDCRAWIMSKERSVNIDTEWDFLFAEWLISEKLVCKS